MKGRLFAVSALAAGAACAFWWSCSSEEPVAPGHDGGAGSGGAGALDAFGGSSATGGTPSGGSGGASDGGIDWGAQPKWESTGSVAAGCPIERLTNAAELRVFAWQPCSWSPSDCEDAVFNTSLVGSTAGGGFSRTSSVQDDGAVVRVGLAFEVPRLASVFATADGKGLDGIRSSDPTQSKCYLAAASVWGNRFGVYVGPLDDSVHGGIVGEIGAMSKPPVAFTLGTHPMGGPQQFTLGESRWLWWWTPLHTLTTVSALDGSDLVTFASVAQPSPIVALAAPITAGKTFLFEGLEADDAGAVHAKIWASDGVAPASVYLAPPDPQDDYGMPIYANSHLGFFRGIHPKDLNIYDAVELWASPYAGSASPPQPTKVGTLVGNSMSNATVGGWGFAAFPSFAPPNGEQELLMWNLVTGSSRSHVLPDDHNTKVLLGVTHTHLWVGASKLGYAPSAYLMRILLEDPKG